MRVHVAQEQEERLILPSQAIQLGDGHFVQVLGLGATALLPRTPPLEVEVLLKAARGRVAAEAHTGGVIALLTQYFRQRLEMRAQPTLVTQCHDIGAEAIHSCEHGSVAGRGGDGRARDAAKRGAACDVVVNVGRGQPGITEQTHVIRSQTIDAEKYQIGFLLHVLLA